MKILKTIRRFLWEKFFSFGVNKQKAYNELYAYLRGYRISHIFWKKNHILWLKKHLTEQGYDVGKMRKSILVLGPSGWYCKGIKVEKINIKNSS